MQNRINSDKWLRFVPASYFPALPGPVNRLTGEKSGFRTAASSISEAPANPGAHLAKDTSQNNKLHVKAHIGNKIYIHLREQRTQDVRTGAQSNLHWSMFTRTSFPSIYLKSTIICIALDWDAGKFSLLSVFPLQSSWSNNNRMESLIEWYMYVQCIFKVPGVAQK